MSLPTSLSPSTLPTSLASSTLPTSLASSTLPTSLASSTLPTTLTELGYGNNAVEMGTTATYDPATQVRAGGRDVLGAGVWVAMHAREGMRGGQGLPSLVIVTNTPSVKVDCPASKLIFPLWASFSLVPQEFVVNTPSTLAQKYWITNGAVHAQASAAASCCRP